MISSLRELDKVKDEYYRWWSCGGQDCRERADRIAADNFNWVLETAIDLSEKESKR